MSAIIIDLKSDTVTKPTESMKHAMVNSALGDDVYGEDPTVNALQSKLAALLGKQAALFVPSGTMANLIAVMVHCSKRGSEVMVGDQSHIFKYEQGGASHVAGALLTNLRNNPDGTFDLEELKYRTRGSDIHEPITTLAVVENTHNMCGGKVIPLKWLDELASIASQHNLLLHMDGARLFNSSEHLGVPPSRIAKHFDSVSVCFSKGLAAPVGSALAGSYHFIDQARRMRKMLGGGMRQAGVLAAAAIVALDEMVPLLHIDHKRAKFIAKAIHALKLRHFNVDVEGQQTNIVMVNINPKSNVTDAEVLERLGQVSLAEIQGQCRTEAGEGIIVKGTSRDTKTIRLTLHYEINDDMMSIAVKKIGFVLKEIDEKATLL